MKAKSERTTTEFLVIGADAAGYAAAACVARSGVRTAIAATGFEAPSIGTAIEPPNAVWRMLDLHQYDLSPMVSGGAVSSFANGGIASFPDAEKTASRLAAIDDNLLRLWPQFVIDAGSFSRNAKSGLDGSRLLSANALLDDYFENEDLKSHLAAAYVAPFGLVGDEVGSSEALAGLFDAPRRRMSGASLVEALKASALAAGVEFIAGRFERLLISESKRFRILFDDGREIRARDVMASSATLAEAAGLRLADVSPLLRRTGVEAIVSIRYEKKVRAAADAPGACFLGATSRKDLEAARAAMLDGRIDDAPVLGFEIDGKSVVARLPFCPARLRENDEDRDWTGQDRQILGRNTAAAIAKFLAPGANPVREIDVILGPDVSAGLRRRRFDLQPVPAPAPSIDPVGAAVALAMGVVRRG